MLFAQEADFQPDTPSSRALRMILEDEAVGWIFCAVAGPMVVGMVSPPLSSSTAEGGRAAWLEDMIVHPDRQGEGIGVRLLNHALEEAKGAGCTRVTLLTDADNHAAQRFYRRAGFTASRMVPFRRAL